MNITIKITFWCILLYILIDLSQCIFSSAINRFLMSNTKYFFSALSPWHLNVTTERFIQTNIQTSSFYPCAVTPGGGEQL